MTLPAWSPTSREIPSATHRGEPDTSQIHSAVGRALSEWELFQSALIKLFQFLCETPSFAACRAYGTVTAASGRLAMLHAAKEVFFASRDPFDGQNDAEMEALFSAFEKAQQFRNNIAHGITVGFRLCDGSLSGYFLSPPSYATKKVEKISPNEVYLLGASYFYNVADINYYRDRFTQLCNETMRLVLAVNGKYGVLRDEQFHP